VVKPMQPRPPLLGDDSGGMVRKSGQDCHFMSHPSPVA